MKKPQIAYLLLVYRQPMMMGRLMRALASPHAHFFIHVDRKTDAAPFLEQIPEGATVTLVPRVRVYWAGFSQIRAMLNLLSAATRCPQAFRYYCLLTCSDFPIKPREEIEQLLLTSEKEFISIDRRLDESAPRRQWSYVHRYHFMDTAITNPRVTATGMKLFLRRCVSKFEDKLNLWLPRTRFWNGMIPYHGSTYWGLSHDCVAQVLGFIRQHPGYSRYFRTVQDADETFFHTLVRNSSFAGRISHDFEAGDRPQNEYGLHYIDWETPGVYLPKTLDETDLARLLASSACFARKFDESVSMGLLRRLAAQNGMAIA